MGAARTLRATLCLGVAFALPAGAAAAAEPTPDFAQKRFAPGEVLVRYEPGTSGRERTQTRNRADADLERRLALPRLELLDLERGQSVKAAVAELRADPDVDFAEPNFIYRLATTTPDDILFQDLWGLNNSGQNGATPDADIDAPEAWDHQRGSDTITVAVVDSGVATIHPDLAGNIWVNSEEDAGTAGIDDNDPPDGNGFVDDLNGWDFVAGEPDPTDLNGHGTHVAGTIGALGNNNTGVTGVNWDVSLMALRACNSLGSCLNSDVADAFTYAGENGAHVVNASISGSSFSSSQRDAIEAADETLFVVAAGNNGTNNDVTPRYPCNYGASNLICVAAGTDRDGLASFSNFGSNAVDLAAPGGGSPGVPVMSTYLQEPVTQTFSDPLSGSWLTGGLPDTWVRTDEPTELDGGTLTDSEGADHAAGADNFARFGPVDLSLDAGCHVRYDLELDLPDEGSVVPPETADVFQVQAASIDSVDDGDYTTLQEFTGEQLGTGTPDLSAFSGSGFSTVFLRFRLLADGDAVVGDGAHVDNVRVRCPSDGYKLLQGTSMATPHVAGAAALLLAQDDSTTVAQLREWLLDGVDLKPAFDGRVASGGRLNLARSLSALPPWNVDIHAPKTTIVGGPAGSSTSTSATFSFVADESATFACSLNGSAFTGCSTPHTLSGLPIGTHSFRVRATDAFGNVEASPAAYGFGVEATPVTKPKPNPCKKLRKKLKRAKKKKAKRKLRKKIRKRCPKKKRKKR